MRANDYEFIPQFLVLTGKHGKDVVSCPLFCLSVCEVMIKALVLFPLDDWFEFQLTKLLGNKVRGEGITGCARIAAEINSGTIHEE